MRLARIQVDATLSHAIGLPVTQLLNSTIGEQLMKISSSANAANHMQSIALISEHEQLTITYERLIADVVQVANGLVKSHAITRGAHIAIYSGNCYHYLVAQFACASIGAICWLFGKCSVINKHANYVEVYMCFHF